MTKRIGEEPDYSAPSMGSQVESPNYKRERSGGLRVGMSRTDLRRPMEGASEHRGTLGPEHYALPCRRGLC